MSLVYNRHAYRLQHHDFNPAGTIKMMLTDAGYTPNRDHNVVTDVTNEITTINYSRKTVAGSTVTEDDTNDRSGWTVSPVTWAAIGNSTQTARWAVAYEDLGGADSANPLIAAFDISAPTGQLLDGNDLTVTPQSAGLVTAST